MSTRNLFPIYYSQSHMFEKRHTSWRLLRLITRLAFLPGFFVLIMAMFAFFSYQFSTDSHFSIAETTDDTPFSVHVHNPDPDSLPVHAPISVVDHRDVVMNSKHKTHAHVIDVKTNPLMTPPTAHVASTCQWGKYAKWPYVESPAKLSPYRRKLLYIKTPKSSSSTVAHILQRYTTREGLIVGYPDFKHAIYTLLDESYVETAKRLAGISPTSHLDAIVSHMVYNSTWANAALGTDRPFRITSIREPVARSWSMFLHGLEWNISTFSFGAKDPWQFARVVETDGQIAYMAGFGTGLDMNNVQQVANHYDHFVISHRVVESLVTLAPKLGLRADDLLFFSQKTSMSSKRPLDILTGKQKQEVDAQLRKKTRNDRAIFDIANERLDREMAMLKPETREIIADVPLMKMQVKMECGHISAEDNSCIKHGESVWDGNSVCVARCIAKWADKNIRCTQ